MPKSLKFGVSMVVLAALALAAILPLATAAQGPEVNVAELRVVNALVGLGPVDVYLDNTLVAASLPIEQATIHFVVPAGQHNVAVRLTGDSILDVPVADTLVTLVPNQSQTLVAYQKQFATSNPDNPDEEYQPPFEQMGAFIALNDNRSPIELGKTRLSAVHLAIGAPERLSIAYPSRASLLHEVQLEQPYGTVDIASNSYSLTVVDATTPELALVERVGELTFNAGVLYTLIVVPDLPPVDIAAARQETQTDSPLIIPVNSATSQARLFVIDAPIDPPANGMRLRVFHAAHNTAVVDVYIDERLVAPRVNYSRYTQYIGLENYSHTVTLRPRDAAPDSEPLGTARFSITPEALEQDDWTIVLLNATAENVNALELVSNPPLESNIVNTPGGPLLMVLVPDNMTQTSRGFARLRLLHALDGASTLTVSTPLLPLPEPPLGAPTQTPTATLSPNEAAPPPVQLLQPAAFGQPASEEEVPAGLYSELNVLAGSGGEIINIPDARLVEGVIYTIVVIGSPSGDPPLSYVMLEDFGRGISLDRLYVGRISVNAPSANVRQLATDQSALVSNLPNDYEVEVLGRDNTGAWIRVRYLEPDTTVTREGWVASRLVVVTRLGIPINFFELPEYVAPPETPTPQ
jgi:hypothetical protein